MMYLGPERITEPATLAVSLGEAQRTGREAWKLSTETSGPLSAVLTGLSRSAGASVGPSIIHCSDDARCCSIWSSGRAGPRRGCSSNPSGVFGPTGSERRRHRRAELGASVASHRRRSAASVTPTAEVRGRLFGLSSFTLLPDLPTHGVRSPRAEILLCGWPSRREGGLSQPPRRQDPRR